MILRGQRPDLQGAQFLPEPIDGTFRFDGEFLVVDSFGDDHPWKKYHGTTRRYRIGKEAAEALAAAVKAANAEHDARQEAARSDRDRKETAHAAWIADLPATIAGLTVDRGFPGGAALVDDWGNHFMSLDWTMTGQTPDQIKDRVQQIFAMMREE